MKYLSGCRGIIFQKDQPGGLSVHWMNAIVIDTGEYGHARDELAAHLKENGVDTRLLFVGMHRQRSLRDFGCDYSGDYPVTDWLTENGLYLPSASNLSEGKIEYICSIIKRFHK